MLCVEKAFDENRVLKQPKELSINKVGHGMVTNLCLLLGNSLLVFVCACRRPYVVDLISITLTKSIFCSVHAAMHDLDPDFRKFSRSEKVAAIAASLGYKRPAPIQSMAIFKVCQS